MTTHNLREADLPRCWQSSVGPLAPGDKVVGPYGVIGEIRSIRGDGTVAMDVLISPLERMASRSIRVGDQALIWAAQISARAQEVR